MTHAHRLTALSFLTAIAMTVGACSKSSDGDSKPSAAQKQSDQAAQAGKGASKQEGDHKDEGKLKLTKEEADAAGLKVAQLVERATAAPIVLTATIQANQDRLAHVAPRVPSRIVAVAANLGDVVKQGQTLARLDSLELGEAHSAYLKARTEVALAEKNFERAERLYNEQIVPQKDYLRARAERDIAASAVRAAADRVRMLGVNVEKLSPNTAVSGFALASPFSGTVTEKHAIIGELAQPDKSLFTIADLSSVWIEADLYEKDLGRVKVGSRAVVTVTAYPNENFTGRVAYISSTLNKETRTLRARIEVPNQSARLKPDMFATAAIDTPTTVKGLFAPAEAVVLMQGQTTVFVEEAGAFEARAVETGEKLPDGVAIKSGVKAGERIVTAGAYALKAKVLKSQIGDTH